MNQNCNKSCSYREICNLSPDNTLLCKVGDDKEAQDFRKSTILGYKTEDLLKMQYNKKVKNNGRP